MKTHELKTRPEFFEAVWSGDKTFEARRDDRGFEVEDVLVLREWEPLRGPDDAHVLDEDGKPMGQHTGRYIRARVTYVLRGGAFGIEPGHAVLALHVISRAQSDSSQVGGAS